MPEAAPGGTLPDGSALLLGLSYTTHRLQSPAMKKKMTTVNRTTWTTRFAYMLMLASLVAVIGTTPAHAQDSQEYKRAYNAGLEAMKAFKQSKKPADLARAHDAFKRTAPLAEQQGASDIARKAKQYMARIDYTLGTASFKAEKYEESLTYHERGLQEDPSYVKNHYGKGKALQKLDRMDEALAELKIAADSKDSKTSRAATDTILKHFLFLASSTLSKEHPTAADGTKALEYLETLQQYVEPDADTYYYMAEAYNAKGEYQQSIAMADKALAIHRGSRTDKAKIYFVKGESLMSLQRYDEAKSAFRNAAYGSYRQSAQHYIETLGTR